MKRTALVVDDDAPILEVLTMRLESMGLAVTATGHADEALKCLDAQVFDVALFDLRMAPLDGLALLKEAHARQPWLPVLIMTAHGTIDGAVHAIKHGAFDYLTKPFVPEELRGKIGRALADRRWARDRRLLRTLGELLASASNVDAVLEAVARATLDATETTQAVVFLHEDGELVPRASVGTSAASDEALRIVARATVAGATSPGDRTEEGTAILAAPLVVDRRCRGALVVASPSYVAPTTEDRELLALFASQAAAALKNSDELARARSGALAALGRVATQVAHEINNPLGGLKVFVTLVEKRLADAGDTHGVDLMKKAHRAIDRLADLVTDITTFGRAAALRREPVAPNDLVQECLALVQDRIEARGIAVVCDLDDAVGEIGLDARGVQRALLNLVVNGIDAMEHGGTLTLQTRITERAVTVSVADTGCGIDEDTQARIFDLFFTTKADGTGMGMAIVRSTVERHGGQVLLESVPGQGTRVTLAFPRA